MLAGGDSRLGKELPLSPPPPEVFWKTELSSRESSRGDEPSQGCWEGWESSLTPFLGFFFWGRMAFPGAWQGGDSSEGSPKVQSWAGRARRVFGGSEPLLELSVLTAPWVSPGATIIPCLDREMEPRIVSVLSLLPPKPQGSSE